MDQAPPEQRPAGAGNSGKGQNHKTGRPPHHSGNFRPTAEGLPWDPHSEAPISRAHGIVDTDLARDNLENDIPAADLQDL